MNILHITAGASSSSACTRLHRAMINEGIESNILSGEISGDIEQSIEVNTDNMITKIKRYLMWLLIYKNTQPEYENWPISFGRLSRLKVDNSYIKRADVVHLHVVDGYLSISDIRKIEKMGKPIVWTCHDEWPNTGLCHCSDGCIEYQKNECKNCKMIRGKIAHKNYKYKKKMLSDERIYFISPSPWMNERNKMADLYYNKKSFIIPNTEDFSIFSPKSETAYFDELGINKADDKIDVLFGCTDSRIPYKGYKFLKELMIKIYKENNELAKKIQIHIIGNSYEDKDIEDKFSVVRWGFVENQNELATIYSFADVLIYPSMADTFPYVVCESLACETPVLTFKTGGIPSMVVHKENGYIVEQEDVEGLYRGLIWILDNNKTNNLGKNGRDKIIKMCDSKKVVEMHMKVYEEAYTGSLQIIHN